MSFFFDSKRLSCFVGILFCCLFFILAIALPLSPVRASPTQDRETVDTLIPGSSDKENSTSTDSVGDAPKDGGNAQNTMLEAPDNLEVPDNKGMDREGADDSDRESSSSKETIDAEDTIALKEILVDSLNRLVDFAKKKDITLMLVFNLDGLLTGKFLLQCSEIKKDLTQELYDTMNAFFQRNRDYFLIIYNTSRRYPIDQLSTDESGSLKSNRMIRQTNKISISLKKTVERTVVNNTTEEKYKFLHVPFNEKDKNNHMDLPLPDILITGVGSRIDFSDELTQRIGLRKIQKCNDQIYSWREKDMLQVQAFLDSCKSLLKEYHYVYDLTYMRLSVWDEEGHKQLNGLFRQKATSENQWIHTSVENFGEDQYVSFLHNFTVNKATTFRIARHLLSRNQSENKHYRFIIFGGTIRDLPMLRPDLEGLALADLPAKYVKKRNRRIPKGRDDLAPQWLTSVISDCLYQKLKGSGEYIAKALDHERVATCNDSDFPVLEMLETAADQIEHLEYP